MGSGPITSWQIEREEVASGTDFIFLGSKITADNDCSHEIKRCFLRRRKAMTKLDSILKSRDINLPVNVHILKAVVLSIVRYGCEELDHKEGWPPKNGHFQIVVLEKTLERVLRVPRPARRSNLPMLKEINWIFIGRTDAGWSISWNQDSWEKYQ